MSFRESRNPVFSTPRAQDCHSDRAQRVEESIEKCHCAEAEGRRGNLKLTPDTCFLSSVFAKTTSDKYYRSNGYNNFAPWQEKKRLNSLPAKRRQKALHSIEEPTGTSYTNIGVRPYFFQLYSKKICVNPVLIRV